MPSILVISLVMAGSGALGGWMNHLMASQVRPPNSPLWHNIVIGVGAAFVIPLFLNSVSANLIAEVVSTDGKTYNPSKIFVLIGFCIIAAVASRRFLETITDELFKKVDENRKSIQTLDKKTDVAVSEAEGAKDTAEKARLSLSPFMEVDFDKEKPNLEARDANKDQITAEEQAILAASMSSRYTMRTITGLDRDSGLNDRVRTNKIVNALIGKGYMAQAVGNAGQPLWYATALGRRVADLES